VPRNISLISDRREIPRFARNDTPRVFFGSLSGSIAFEQEITKLTQPEACATYFCPSATAPFFSRLNLAMLL
jgi:hypothetical protein